MSHPLVLDLETQHSFREFSDPQKLKISVVGVYDYGADKFYAFEENELSQLFTLIEQAAYIVGFNIVSFDLPVLQAYYPGKVESLATFDILDDIRSRLGRRISLDDVVSATLGQKKSGHGLQAIEFYKEGKLAELKKYCLDDVRLTKEVFDYGLKNKEIYYPTTTGRSAIKVDWDKQIERKKQNDLDMTLPF